jgi:hypothetical protein
MKLRYFPIVFPMKSCYFPRFLAFKFVLDTEALKNIYINIQFFLSKCNRGLSIIKGLAICARISEVNVI